ncbi:MAG: helix-turn-helix domain-containing protein, partial [Lewinella sp.]|nr:helix-turn-helix domain-containing protein [Lewinella sp.]
EAYNAYLKGRFHQLKWGIDHFHRAIGWYEEALRLDPAYPMPYVGLVQCYTYLFMWRAIPRAEVVRLTGGYLDQLARLSPELAEYHLARSSCAILLDWDFALAHAELEKTLALHPANTDALEALAGLCIVIGAFEEGLRAIDRALAVNPLSANHAFMKGNLHYFAGAYEPAIEWMDRAMELDPHLQLAPQVKMAALLLLDQPRAFADCVARHREFPFAGHFETLRQLMQGEPVPLPEGDLQNEFQPWVLYFAVHSGRLEEAFAALQHGLDQQLGQYFCFRYDPFLAPLRDDARFEAINRAFPAWSIHPAAAREPVGEASSSRMEAAEIEQSLAALARLMEEARPYLDPALSLKSLAESLALHPNKLSWLLNEQLGRNFNEYINTFRLAAFKTRALDPANGHLTLLGLAYESGFNSKSVFNAFFKKMEGVTPRAWVKRQG